MRMLSRIPSAVQEERSSMGDGPPSASFWLEDGGLETPPPTPGGPVQAYLMTGRIGAFLHMVRTGLADGRKTA